MQKKALKLGTKLNLIVGTALLVLVILLSAVIFIKVTEGVKMAAVEKAKSDLTLGYAYIDAKYPGDWVIEDDQLYKGETLINNNFELVDEIGNLTNDTVTIFQEDTRVTTNVKKEGERAVGTQVSADVWERITSGKNYYGEADVVGHTYQTAYQPIQDNKGNVIGIWYVGANQSFVSTITKDISYYLYGTLLIVALVTILVITLFTQQMKKRLLRLTESLEYAGNGDFTHEVIDSKMDEIGHLSHSYQQMKNKLSILINQVVDAIDRVSSSANELSASTDETSKATEQITDSIFSVSSNSENQLGRVRNAQSIVQSMNHSIDEMTNYFQQVSVAQQETEKLSQKGNTIAEEAVSQMNHIDRETKQISNIVHQLGNNSSKIGEIVSVITDISEQTNLLALNAAIEAARAGEQGKGFAVVANEVGKLAEQSNHAANNISSLISEMQKQITLAVSSMDNGNKAINSGIDVVNEAGIAFKDIFHSISELVIQLQKVETSIGVISKESDELGRDMTEVEDIIEATTDHSQEVSAAAEQQNASMEEIASASQILTKTADELKETIQIFKVQ